MHRGIVLLAFGILLLGNGFSEESEESDFYHYCYRLCCLNQDAVYVEGPPQNCIGAGPDFQSNLERCHAQCLYEMNFTGGTIGGEFVEYVDRGEEYVPQAETSGEVGPETPESGPAVEEEPYTEPAPVNVSGEEPAQVPAKEEAPLKETGETPICAVGMALLLALLFAKR